MATPSKAKTNHGGDTKTAACGIIPRPDTGEESQYSPVRTEPAPEHPTAIPSSCDEVEKAACDMASCPNTGDGSQCPSGGAESTPEGSHSGSKSSKPAGNQLSDDMAIKTVSDKPSRPDTGRGS
ncbi:hypothetical protein H072_678 [Dactylellina haptotyla CBS 200.50]|uniref:Uncharacterized protein n=1 Tax=Dactylellina haptotyla (strain CBS 200.50) TaxID=1284197 RepID=S8AQX7_DACHA|nr:hypothetical protein H072_678 [Dactylellina haptotyla CBS 200.50]